MAASRSAVLAIRGPLAAGREHGRFYGYAAALLPEREFVSVHP